MKKEIRRRIVALIMTLVFSFTSIAYNGHSSQAEEDIADVDSVQTEEAVSEVSALQLAGETTEAAETPMQQPEGGKAEAAETSMQQPEGGTAEAAETSMQQPEGGKTEAAVVSKQQSEGRKAKAAEESGVQLHLQDAEAIVPDTEYALSISGEDGVVGDVPSEYILKTSAENVLLQKSEGIWKLKYSAVKEPVLKEITVEVYKPGTPDGTLGDLVVTDTFPVSDSGVDRGKDFDIADTEGIYAAFADKDEVHYIYHSESEKPLLHIVKARYTAYRYCTDGVYSGDYTAFGEDEDRRELEIEDGAFYLQMKNDNVSPTVFGSSKRMQVVSDKTAPVLKLLVNDKEPDSLSEEIRLKKGDTLTVKAVEQVEASGIEGSGIAKITQVTQEEESLLIQTKGRETEVSVEIPYTEESTAFTIYAYDNVGNRETLQFSVSADTTLPVIELQPGVDAYTYEGDKGYYVDAIGKEAVTAAFWDENLDVASIKCDGPVSPASVPGYVSGYPYTIAYQATGSGEVTFGAKDTYGNEAEEIQVPVVVDTIAPVLNEATVHVTDADAVRKGQNYRVYSPYHVLYDAEAFHEPLLSFQVTEENLLKIEVELGDSNNVITLYPNTPEGNVYTYTDVPLGEAAEFVRGNIKITVYDKVMHKTVYTYQNPLDNKVTYIKSEAELGIPEISNPKLEKSGKTYVALAQGRMYMHLHVSAGLLVSELLEVRLMRVAPDGSRTQVASYRDKGQDTFTVEGSDGEWDILFDHVFNPADDGVYMMEAYYMDIALNQVISTESQTLYYIDQTPITLSASSAQVSHGGRTNQTVQVVYTMKEENPDFSSIRYDFNSEINSARYNIVNVSIVKPDGTRESVLLSELTTRLNDSSVWKKQGDTYTLTLEYAGQSRYETMLIVEDMMGNGASAAYNFWLDTDAPAITSVDIKTQYENKNNQSYEKFDSSTAEITVDLREEIALAEQVSIVCKTRDAQTGEEKEIMPSGFTQTENVFTYTFSLKKDFKGHISFETSDGLNHGDSSGPEMENGIILEGKEMHQQSSAYSITENGTPNENGFYRKDVSLRFSAQDSYSGIRTIEYSLNGKRTTEDFSESKTLKTDWEKNPVYMKAVKENEGNQIKAVLTVVDNAGHRDTVEKTLKIDATRPEISVTYDNNRVQNGKYYKENRIATITIRELNYDARTTSVIVYKDGEPVIKEPAFHSDGKVKKAEDGTQYKEYEMKLPFTEDGNYTFEVETTDLAGNKGAYTLKSEFTIDKTPPKMEVRFDNNASFSEQYFGEGRTATITVTEHNFDPSGIVADVSASRDGAEIAAPAVSGFTSKGDVHTAQLSFSDEADYSIAVTSMDLAGNVGDAFSPQSFTVDLTAPEIVITGVSEGLSYNREVKPVVTVIDGNFDAESVTIEITGGRNGAVEDVTPSMTQTDQGYSYSYPNLRYIQGYDDCYTIWARAVDKSGHEAEAFMQYRVNRFGSTYVLNDALQKMVDSYYGHASDEYSIIETNVDTLTQYQVSYTLDGEIVNLKEGTDYTVEKTEDMGSWNQYEYKLNASVFEREGVYAITVASRDAAGNVTDNKAKNTVMEFCIDNTAPSCIISGVSEGQHFNKDEAVSIGVEVYDNTRLDRVAVILNGTEIYTEQDLADGKLTDIAIDRTVRNQSLTVQCYDAAGNERTETIHFICQVSVFDMPAWIWGIIAAAGAGVIALSAVVLRRRKRGKTI